MGWVLGNQKLFSKQKIGFVQLSINGRRLSDYSNQTIPIFFYLGYKLSLAVDLRVVLCFENILNPRTLFKLGSELSGYVNNWLQSFGYFIVFCGKRWLSFVLCSWAVFLENFVSFDCQYLLGVSTPRKWIPSIIPPRAPPIIYSTTIPNQSCWVYTQRSQGPKHIINYVFNYYVYMCIYTFEL